MLPGLGGNTRIFVVRPLGCGPCHGDPSKLINVNQPINVSLSAYQLRFLLQPLVTCGALVLPASQREREETNTPAEE